MDKRVILAAALSMGILLFWSYLFPPPERPPAPAPEEIVEGTGERPDRPDRPDRQTPREPYEPAAADRVAAAEEAPPSDAVVAEAVEEIRLENDVYRVVLTNRGGRAVSWMLNDYTTDDGDPLELLPQFVEREPQLFGIELDDPALAAAFNEALYRVEREPVSGSDGLAPGTRIRFSWADGRGLEAVKSLTFREGSYLVDLELAVSDRGRLLPARMRIGPGFGAQELGKKRGTYYYAGQGAWNSGGSVTRLRPKKITKEAGRFAAGVRWAGLEDQYFTALVLPGAEMADVAWRPVEGLTPVGRENADEPPDPVVEAVFSVGVPPEGARLYVGPKKYTLLRELGSDLGKSVWFASNGFLAAIARFIFLCLIWIHDHTIPNYGLAIILATVALRVMLFPVNQYSMVSMKRTQLQMQKLQPKIKGIRAKYKKAKDAESRAKMNQETMELYRREGVNPMGGLNGCLPMLAQFPILIGFYNMLTVAVELRGAPFFGWIQDLSQRDAFYVTPLLMGVTMFVQQRMAMSKVKDPVQQQQQKFMMIMPVMFTWICINMPAGMVLYWFVNNLLAMGQQWIVNHHTTRLEAASSKATQKA